MILIFAGLGFKAAAVPFHFYAPDVYQATTNANAGLLAVVPKAAALLAIMRLTIAAAPAAGDVSWKIAVVMSIASMTLGNACALWQRDLRRMLAYSSIANAGYMLIGVAAALAAGQAPVGYDGFGATLLSLIVYSVAALGAFATLAYLSDGQRETSQLDQLGGLPKRRPLAAALLTIFMFSLSGIPPLAGFWGKLTLFTSALEQFRETAAAPTWFLVLLIAAALNAAVAAAYYLRVIATMYFGSDEAAGAGNGVSQLAGVSAVACGVFVVACGLFPGSLVERTGAAGQSAHSSQTPLVLESARAAERPIRGTY
jgi:NADH-quinone oxidoreductase subunit N